MQLLHIRLVAGVACFEGVRHQRVEPWIVLRDESAQGSMDLVYGVQYLPSVA